MKVLNSYGITKKENGVENVRNSKVSQKEDKLIQQKLQEAFGYTDEQLAAQLDQAAAEYAADSAAVADLRSDDLHYLDSLALARFDAAQRGVDTTTKRKVYKKGWFMSDSMSLSKVCWLSTVLPGYGQVYNRQYWKLPVLYGTVGAGLALFLHENKTYKPLKRAYESYTNTSLARTPELDALQTKMIRSKHPAADLPGHHHRLVRLFHRRRGR